MRWVWLKLSPFPFQGKGFGDEFAKFIVIITQSLKLSGLIDWDDLLEQLRAKVKRLYPSSGTLDTTGLITKENDILENILEELKGIRNTLEKEHWSFFNLITYVTQNLLWLATPFTDCVKIRKLTLNPSLTKICPTSLVSETKSTDLPRRGGTFKKLGKLLVLAPSLFKRRGWGWVLKFDI